MSRRSRERQAARDAKADPAVVDDRAAMLAAWRLGDPVCHAQMDGDCDWPECPQAVNYQSHCPLPHWTEDPEY